MRKPKFNIEIFFKTFAKEENISKEMKEKIDADSEVLLTYSLSCAYGEKDENNYLVSRDYTSECTFENPKKDFSKISKDFEYIPLIQLINDDRSYSSSKNEYGYLYTKKSNISFLISGVHADWGDGQHMQIPELIMKFKNFNKKKFTQLPKIVLNSLDKRELCNIVNFNEKFKWNIKLLKKTFKNSAKDRIKSIKKPDLDLSSPLNNYYETYKEAGFKGNYSQFLHGLTKDKLREFDWYYNISFFKMNEKKMSSNKPFLNINEAFMKI